VLNGSALNPNPFIPSVIKDLQSRAAMLNREVQGKTVFPGLQLPPVKPVNWPIIKNFKKSIGLPLAPPANADNIPHAPHGRDQMSCRRSELRGRLAIREAPFVRAMFFEN
jgi:hypothetical protein